LGAQPLRLQAARSVRLTGHGEATVLSYGGRGAAVQVQGSRDITLEDFRLNVFSDDDDALAVGILLQNCFRTTVQDCHLALSGGGKFGGLAIGLNGIQTRTTIREN